MGTQTIRRMLYFILALAVAFQFYWHWSSIIGVAERHDKLSGWAQALGSFIALGIAIWVPWVIHRREQRAAALPRQRQRALLANVLVELHGGVIELIQAEALLGAAANDIPIAINGNNIGVLAPQHEEIIRALLQASALLRTVLEQSQVDQYELLRPIMSLRDRLIEFSPELAKEANILRRHPTVGVLMNSIPTTSYVAGELRVWIEQAQDALNQ